MPRLSSRAKSQVYSNLEKYARSGMGMDKACESLLSQPRVPAGERKIYQGLLKGLQAGESIGQSMARGGMVVTPLEREVIAAAESGGMLEKGFSHLASYFRKMDATMRRIRKGMTYPLFLLHAGLPLTVLSAAALSRFDPSGGDIRPWGEVLWESGRWVLILYLAVWVLILLVVAMVKIARRSPFFDSLLRAVPLVGKTRKFVALERFCRVFEIFLLAGLKMSDTLRGAGKASGSALVYSASLEGSRNIAAGSDLASNLFSHPRAFPNDFARGVSVAEESGQLDSEMQVWGNFYAESAAESMDSIAEWTPKLFYWIVLLVVAFMIIRAGMAYIGLIEGLADPDF